MNAHDSVLDDLAMLALGALTAPEAAALRAHIATCEGCAREYARLKAVTDVLALGAEEPDAIPSLELRRRVITVASARRAAPIALAAYIAAAAALLLALIFGTLYTATNTRLREQNVVIRDVTASSAQHYRVPAGEVVRNGDRIYLALRGLPAQPAGKVFQAWTLPKGSKRVFPSVTFTAQNGAALIRLPVRGAAVAAVAVSIEPAGGSSQPTSKPLFIVRLRVQPERS